MVQKFKNGFFLPYYKGKSSKDEARLSVYLRHKFVPLVCRAFPQHGLVQRQPVAMLAYLHEHSKTHRFFLRFNVALLYPSVSQPTVASVLLENYRRLSGKTPPILMQQRVNRGFSRFFCLPMGTSLSVITGHTLLLGLCDTLSGYPFLCYHDDFLVLLPSRNELKWCMCCVLAELAHSGLKLNLSKVNSGLLASDTVSFIGFRYTGGTFGVDAEKETEFRDKIKRMTSLVRRYKSQAAFIKLMNRAINIFGHYYKHASVRLLFARLDMYICQRVRRYLVSTYAFAIQTPNLGISNELLHGSYGLRSLVDIFDGQKRPEVKPILRRAKPVKSAFAKYRIEELPSRRVNLLNELINVQYESHFAFC